MAKKRTETSYKESTNTETILDSTGNIVTQKETKKTTKITRNAEPDYIKIYTEVWSAVNEIPIPDRELFLQLVVRMTYCNADKLEGAQLVNTGKPYSNDINNSLGWKPGSSTLNNGLCRLVKCGAIRRIAKSVYQINPNYAGRGEWRYNPSLKRGGVEKLKASFTLSPKGNTFKSKIVWADDGAENKLNEMYRIGLGAKPSEETVLTCTAASILATEIQEEDTIDDGEKRTNTRRIV